MGVVLVLNCRLLPDDGQNRKLKSIDVNRRLHSPPFLAVNECNGDITPTKNCSQFRASRQSVRLGHHYPETPFLGNFRVADDSGVDAIFVNTAARVRRGTVRLCPWLRTVPGTLRV